MHTTPTVFSVLYSPKSLLLNAFGHLACFCLFGTASLCLKRQVDSVVDVERFTSKQNRHDSTGTSAIDMYGQVLGKRMISGRVLLSLLMLKKLYFSSDKRVLISGSMSLGIGTALWQSSLERAH